MTQAQANRNSHVRTFQQKILNRSCSDFLFLDRLADYLLECCNAQAKPNTLSLLSFLPLFALTFVIQGPSAAGFVFTALCLLLHQLLDIANKKQAYRLSQFSLATYFIDHLFDALSCVSIVLVFTRLLSFSPSSLLTSVFFFGMLPFYIHHLAMYNNGYLTFPVFSPPTDGLLIIQFFCLASAFLPNLPQLTIAGIAIYQIITALASVWLLIFLITDIISIVRGKSEGQKQGEEIQEFPLKNLFVISSLGYVLMEVTTIQYDLLLDSTYFYLVFALMSLQFAHIINRLVLSYGFGERFKQIHLSFLLITGLIVIFYALCSFVREGQNSQSIIGKVLIGSAMVAMLGYFIRDSWLTVQKINDIIAS